MAEDECKVTPSPPDAKSWLEHAVKMQQEAPKRFEEAAKFLTTIISLTLTLYLTASHRIPINPILAASWFIALFLAFMVMYPRKYTFNRQSAENIKKKAEEMVKRKRRFFIAAALLYFFPPLLFLTSAFLHSESYCEKENREKSLQHRLPVVQEKRNSGSN